MTTFRLQSKDGELVEISSEALQQSITLRTMIEGTDLESGDTPIPLDNLDGATIRKVVEWCEKHKKDAEPQPEPSEPGPKPAQPPFDMTPWDRQFLGVDAISIPEMATLIQAANYLDIPLLYKYCCKRIFLDYIKDRSVEQLRAVFEPREESAPPNN
uniref:Skp1-related protein n=1 Tax=Steinernema glaseri TaxID=37863 RepID=A0A1I8ASR6_9BILA